MFDVASVLHVSIALVITSVALPLAPERDRTEKLVDDRGKKIGSDEADVIKSLQEAYLNGHGVVVKMLECGHWHNTYDLHKCALQSLDKHAGSVLRFDLPATHFLGGHHVGWLFTEVPLENQLCASPLDGDAEACDDLKTCSDTPEDFVRDFHYHMRNGGNKPYGKGKVFSECFEKGLGGWERAFAKQHALFQNLSTTWSSDWADTYASWPANCMLWNQVMLKDGGGIQSIKAIAYRNDSFWPESYPDRQSPLLLLAYAKRIQSVMQSIHKIYLPIVELTTPHLECNWPNATVARWKQGKGISGNRFFSIVTGQDPRLESAGELMKTFPKFRDMRLNDFGIRRKLMRRDGEGNLEAVKSRVEMPHHGLL